MKKQTKSSLTTKLDKVCSRIIRSKGICEFCGETNYEKLQCCHIYSRTYKNTRWDLKNLLCLCASCHFYSHKNPLWFSDRVKSYLGELETEKLKSLHLLIKKWSIKELTILLDVLEKEEKRIYEEIS